MTRPALIDVAAGAGIGVGSFVAVHCLLADAPWTAALFAVAGVLLGALVYVSR